MVAGVTRIQPVTAPGLLKMHTRPARAFATVVVIAAAFSILADRGNVTSLPLLLLAIAVGAAGAAGLVSGSEDPMPPMRAWGVAAAGPVATLLTCLAIPGPLSNPNQMNAVGVGVAIGAFLCVRGRVAAAWCGLAAMMAVVIAWASLTSQGAVSGLLLTLPNVAVLLMATLFAVVIRPAAAAIRRLHAQAVRESEVIAATGARNEESDRQRRRLLELAGPTLELIAAGTPLSEPQVSEGALIGGQLRDAVRGRILDEMPVVAAVRAARARGVTVAVLDDHGMDDADPDLVTTFRRNTIEWLSSATIGRLTIRVHPPQREWLATIVAAGPDGGERRFQLHADGTSSTR